MSIQPKSKQCIVILCPEGSPAISLAKAAKDLGYSVILATVEPLERYKRLVPYLAVGDCEKQGLCDEVIVAADLGELLGKLKQFQIAAVIPGSEIAVNYSDEIASAFRLPCNDPATAIKRRNKMAMKQAMIQANLKHAMGRDFVNLTDAISFVENELQYPVVVKPPAGAGGQNVFVCHTLNEFIEKFNRVKNTVAAYFRSSESVLVEEYLEGDEYAVNLFCTPSRVIVTSIWKYKLINTVANTVFINGFILQEVNDPRFDELKEYAIAFSKAVDIKIGSVHSEIRITPRGPIGHEIAARIIGGNFLTYFKRWTNFDVAAKNLDVFIRGTTDLPSSIERRRFIAVAIPPVLVQGKLRAIHGMEAIRKLKSYYKEELFLKPGDDVTYSCCWDDSKIFFWLCNKDRVQLEKDLESVQELFHLEVI